MRNIIFVFWVLSLALMLGGCSERIESTSYYGNPGWTRDGKIILVKTLQVVRKDAIGNQLGTTNTESVSTITSAGTGEAFLFDVTDALPYDMSCSPTTDYVGYLDDLRDGLFGKVVIRNISSITHTGLDKAEISFSPGIKSFDWSDDAKKIVYCTTREVHTVNLDGSGDTLIVTESNLEFVAWKYGGRIAFVYTTSGNKILSLIYADKSGRIDQPASASVDKPQISPVNTNEVYGIAGGSYCKVDVSAGTATSEILANFKGALPRLSAAADKVTYSKDSEQTGIYVLDLTTKAESAVK